MDLIEKIGPILGLVAFFGLSVLAFLLFQQSRDIRRLREWAGRAPERAADAADASLAAAEARGEARDAADGVERPGRLKRWWGRIRGAVVSRLQAVDRHLPVDGRYVALVLLIAVVAAGVLTSGFGLVGGASTDTNGHQKPPKPDVAVLNATQSASGIAVPGLAHTVSVGVVKPAGYKVVAEDNASQGLANTTVMYQPGFKEAADALQRKIQPKLGHTPVAKMTPDVKASTKGADVALVIGIDDSTFGQ